MPADLHVYLPRSSMLAPEQWAAAIIDAGYEAQLDPDFDVDTFNGFLRCSYKGEPAGFEYDSDHLTDNDREALALPAKYDFVVSFITGSSIRDFITSLIASVVLCSQTGGLFSDPESGDRIPAGLVLQMLKSKVSECEQVM
jgi:hypothetical protein